jgi:glucose/arabinose dehydrogenase
MTRPHSRLLIFSLLLAMAASARGATLPPGFVETRLVSGLSAPTAMAFTPDGRLFVCEQRGRLRVVKNGTLLSKPFVTLNVNSAGERGLLGVAIDPNFASNRYVYVYYTATSPNIHNRVSRFKAAGDVAVAGSERILLELNPLSNATNHNGGALHFGPDGKLYIATGENALRSNSQTLGNLLGKILRINKNGSIPTDNPFYRMAAGKNRAIWALGLRNPFTFAFQRQTGRMHINDVGAGSWEEINRGIPGSNYGWPVTEGPTTDPRFRAPFFAYRHGVGPTVGCAITGGAFYDPPTSQFPSAYFGTYLFSDFCSGWIRRLNVTTRAVSNFASGIPAPVDIRTGQDGSLYYLARDAGAVFRIRYTAPLAPSITIQPVDMTATAGSSVTFSVSATGNPTLSYQWQRDGVDIPGATSRTLRIRSAAVSLHGATFRVRVSNARGSVTSREVALSVTPSSR